MPPSRTGQLSARPPVSDGAGWAVPGNRWDLLDGIWPDTPPSISVIIAHYEQPVQLARTLSALARQSHPASLTQIIVVDDGSSQPPVVPEHVRLLVQADRGFRLAAARNLGAAAARNSVLVFLDADTAPEPDYLRQITRLPALVPDSVAVGRRRHAELAAVPADSPVEIAGRHHELAEPAWLRDAYRRSHNLLELDHRSYRFLIGAVLACSRAFFEETGGFDESFTHYGGEDWEWGYRAWLRGAVIAHVPEAVAWHDGPDSAGREGSRLSAKNEETLRLAHLIPVPDSRGRGIPTARADILVVAPSTATPGQRFLTLDSALAELPGSIAQHTDPPSWATVGAGIDTPRVDRVRLVVIAERPLRVRPGALTSALAAINSGNYAEVVLLADQGYPLLRVVSQRAAARQRRWGGEALLPTLELPALSGVEELITEVDLEAYLGGW